MKRVFMIIFLIIFPLFIASCTKKDAISLAKVGSIAPGFTLQDINGKKVSLSDFRDKVVLVKFWATWCPPCRESTPELIAVYNNLKDKGFAILALSVDQGKDAKIVVSEFVKEYSIPYIVLLSDRDTAKKYGISGIPSSFLIDKTGRIVDKHSGFMHGMSAILENEIRKLL